MKGTRITVTSRRRGVIEDVYIVGTPKPGTCMEIDPGVAAVQGIFSYQAAGTQAASGGRGMGNDGDRKCVAILLEKDDEGGTYDNAYTDGDMGRIYYPLPGEQFNMIVQNQEGTGESFVIGDEFMIDDGTGKLLECDTNAEAHPFTGLEAKSALTADDWLWVRFNGAGGA